MAGHIFLFNIEYLNMLAKHRLHVKHAVFLPLSTSSQATQVADVRLSQRCGIWCGPPSGWFEQVSLGKWLYCPAVLSYSSASRSFKSYIFGELHKKCVVKFIIGY